MTPPLSEGFLDRPIAHRGFHGATRNRPENSRAAFEAAIAKGYAIELDLQLSGDGQAMVFHDYDLERLTGTSGALKARDAAALSALPLRHGDETIPTLIDILTLVAGRAPLLIEFKDQDGEMGPDIGALEAAAASALANYRGEVALMSFNPHSVARLGQLLPKMPRGLTTSAFAQTDWPMLPAAVRERLAGIPDLEDAGASFISHDRRALDMPRVQQLRDAGLPVLCWTVRSPEEEAEARRLSRNITFEGYDA